MASRSRSKLSSNHPFVRESENLRAVKAGLTQAERLHKDALRTGNEPAELFLRRMHMLTVGLMAEAQLRKILSDPAGFNELELTALRRARSQFERWRLAVELAFRRHYVVPLHEALEVGSLGQGTFDQYEAITSVLDEHLEPLISDRNKTAHAQWAWHLNNKETAFTGPAPAPLNYRALATRSEAIVIIGDMVHALTVSEPTFVRDFQTLDSRIRALAPLMDGGDQASFAAGLQRQSRT